MHKRIELEKERIRLDREITLFHFGRARQIITRALKEARKRGEWFYIYYFTAQRYILQEDFVRAIRYLNKALKLRKNDPHSYNDKAVCLAELGKYQEALVCFNQGLAKNRDFATLYHNKGWLLNSLGRYQEAIVCFHKALELEPDRPDSFYNLGDSYFNRGQFGLAKKYFSKSLECLRGKSRILYKEISSRLKKFSDHLR